MRKCLLFVLLILCNISLFSQEFEEIFLEKNFVLYRKCLVKLKDDFIPNISFYRSLNSAVNNELPVLFPSVESKWSTDKDSIKNRIFKVESVFDHRGLPIFIEDEIKMGYYDEPIFCLKDTTTNQRMYYRYDTNYEREFPFLCKGINLDKKYLEKDIERIVDKYDGKITINSPLSKDVVLIKVIKNNQVSYYLSLSTIGRTLNIGKYGVNLIFKDGTKWNKQAKIDVETHSGGSWKYSAFIKLNSQDLKLFSNKYIDSFRLYIYDNERNGVYGKIFKEYVELITTMK